MTQNALPFAFGCHCTGHAFRLACEKSLIIFVVKIQLCVIQLTDAVGHTVEEIPVMGDDDDSAFIRLQLLLQPCRSFIVNMVGRFVKNQNFTGVNQR